MSGKKTRTNDTVPVEYIRECFEMREGKIFWKQRPITHFKNEHGRNIYHSKTCGKEFGADSFDVKNNTHYRVGSLLYQGKSFVFKYHILIWIVVYGLYPLYELDHIDGNGLNNKIENLRDVPNPVNSRNMKKFKSNTSGYTGVGLTASGRWYARASAMVGGVRVIYRIGTYDTALEAAIAREKWNKENGYTDRHGK